MKNQSVLTKLGEIKNFVKSHHWAPPENKSIQIPDIINVFHLLNKFVINRDIKTRSRDRDWTEIYID